MTLSTWSKPNDIKEKVKYWWNKGDILRDCLGVDNMFPLMIKIKGPSTNELSLCFADVINWTTLLKENEKSQITYGYELIQKETNYRLIGKNSIPLHAVIPTREDAIRMLHKQKDVVLFEKNAQELLKRWGILEEWILKDPFKLVNNIGLNCDKFVTVLEWFETHPAHNIYIRQLDIQSIDTKFIENNKKLIGELLEIILPREQIDIDSKTFEERFFLKQKPKMVRFRLLDPKCTNQEFTDITISIEEFARWEPTFLKVFFTENEINFLSFPYVHNSCIIFGKGYGVEIFKMAKWINEKDLYYWGDIDTHGFNILSIARGFLPELKSFLMTEDVLLKHRAMWVEETKQHLADIGNLTNEESELVVKLQKNHYGKGVRLEQERIAFGFVKQFLEQLE